MRSSDVFDSSFAASNTPGSPALHRSRRTSDLSMLSTDLSGYRYTCVTYAKELLNLQRRLTKPFFYQPRLITVSRPVVAYRRRKHAGCLCCHAEFILGWYVSFLSFINSEACSFHNVPSVPRYDVGSGGGGGGAPPIVFSLFLFHSTSVRFSRCLFRSFFRLRLPPPFRLLLLIRTHSGRSVDRNYLLYSSMLLRTHSLYYAH